MSIQLKALDLMLEKMFEIENLYLFFTLPSAFDFHNDSQLTQLAKLFFPQIFIFTKETTS